MDAYKVSIKFWLNINEELFKVEYFIKLSQYFKGSHEVTHKTFFGKVSKILPKFKKVFNFEKFVIYV